MLNDDQEMRPRITVFGVGGAGGNAVNNMIDKQLEGVDFVVANTDAQALYNSKAEQRIQIGPKATQGLGAGAKPTVGALAAEETLEEIVDHLMGAHMCFIAAGMGGGTGTGAAPVIAQAAREMGILTVGVVTKPFMFEGSKRMRQADGGIEALQKVVDTLIIIPNQNLFRLANEKTTFTEAFSMADDVLYQGVKGVTDLMVRPGLINLDFADVRSVMAEMGKAMMGTGEASGENRAVEAAEKAIANPLLDDISLNGAKGVLVNVTGGYDLTLFEMDEAAQKIREKVDADANIIVGSTLDPTMEGVIRVSVVATGIDSLEEKKVAPATAPADAKVQATAAELPPRRFQPLHEPQASDIGDDMPAPAYRHPEQGHAAHSDYARESFQEPAQSRPVQQPMHVEPEIRRPQPQAKDYIHVSARHPGTPSQADMDRYQSAHRQAAPAQEPVAPQADQAQSSRTGLSRIIDRLSGGMKTPAPNASIAERVSDRMNTRNAPREADVQFEDLGRRPTQEDQAEIPAFLRRQSN